MFSYLCYLSWTGFDFDLEKEHLIVGVVVLFMIKLIHQKTSEDVISLLFIFSNCELNVPVTMPGDNCAPLFASFSSSGNSQLVPLNPLHIQKYWSP